MDPELFPVLARLAARRDATLIPRTPTNMPQEAPPVASIEPDQRNLLTRFIQRHRLGEQPVARIGQMLGFLPRSGSPGEIALTAAGALPIGRIGRGLGLLKGASLADEVATGLRSVDAGLVNADDLFNRMRDLVDRRGATIKELASYGRNADEKARIADRLKDIGAGRRAIEPVESAARMGEMQTRRIRSGVYEVKFTGERDARFTIENMGRSWFLKTPGSSFVREFPSLSAARDAIGEAAGRMARGRSP